MAHTVLGALSRSTEIDVPDGVLRLNSKDFVSFWRYGDIGDSESRSERSIEVFEEMRELRTRTRWRIWPTFMRLDSSYDMQV